jgi:hypothetical protein
MQIARLGAPYAKGYEIALVAHSTAGRRAVIRGIFAMSSVKQTHGRLNM